MKKIRKSRGITQEQLANMIGCRRETISAIENKKVETSVYVALKIAKALNSTVEELFNEDN